MAEELKGVPGDGTQQMQNLFGAGDENMRLLEQLMEVRISLRGGEIVVEGESERAVDGAQAVIRKLMALLMRGERVDTALVRVAVGLCEKG